MNPNQISSFKSQRARELLTLYELLQNKFGASVNSLDPLMQAYNTLQKDAETKKNSTIWGYKITNLILPLGVNRHIIPTDINSLRVRIDCNVVCDMNNWGKLNDPFESYNFAIIIFGEKDSTRFSICWHIDKDDGRESNEHHPLYHIQYSDGVNHFGKNEDSFNWGHVIYLDSPRIAHYPMDIILGIGFYLTNFHQKGKFEDFLNNHSFRRLYTQSKNNILKPYFLNLTSHWNDSPRNPIWNESNILCPHLC